jgi:multidrug efflux system membrane fusion protein
MEVALHDVPRVIRVVGNVAASATVGVKARVTGELVGVHFTEGQDVQEGQPLFTIDQRPFQASLNEAQSRLERDIAQLNKATEDMKRYGKLVSEGYVSREAYDKAVTDAAALRATVRADEAALESARLQLSYCSITAPNSGRAGAIKADRGNMIKANDDAPLLVLDRLQPVYVYFAVPEARLSEILARQRENKLAIQAVPAGGEASSGTLTFVDNAVDVRTGTIRLRGTFTNENRTLWPGQFVQVTLVLGTDRDVVVIPAKAVQSGRNENFVYVVDADDKAQVRHIVTDPEDDGRMIVRDGLARGDRVVLEGQVRLAPGVPVEIRQQ